MEHLTQIPIVDLYADHLVFETGGVVAADRRRTAGGGAEWRLAMFRAESDADVHADHWERHLHGEEVVGCVRGGFRLHLRGARPGLLDDVVRVRAGDAVIVPRGRWHRLELDEPSDLLVVTIRRGTELVKVAEHAA
jgi:mannose-6-phosphate isomerase-like protein (cupin superfamily)